MQRPNDHDPRFDMTLGTAPRLTTAIAIAVLVGSAIASDGVPVADRVLVLVEDLAAPGEADRDSAEAGLATLASGDAESVRALLAELPADGPGVPPRVAAALGRVRALAQRRLGELATSGTSVTLDVVQAPLDEVLGELHRQTGNRVTDARERFGEAGRPVPVTLDVTGEPFWSAVDRLLDAARLSVYPYSVDGELLLTARGEGERRRRGAAAYAGPFRLEATTVTARRGLRNDAETGLDVRVELAWEPRLRPIAVRQPFDALRVEVAGDGLDAPTLVGPRSPAPAIEREPTSGVQAVDLDLPLQLPPRGAEQIQRIRGTLEAMVPAKSHTFRVERVGAAKLPVERSFGDATVRLERFAESGGLWELRMRLRLASAGDAFESHRSWVFQNPCYLVAADGTRYEQAGFETTLQTDDEVGVLFLFDLTQPGGWDDADWSDDAAEAQPADPAELTWVYETATGVYRAPLDWELGPIELP